MINEAQGKINIENFKDNEIVEYTLLLLKGSIESINDCCKSNETVIINLENQNYKKTTKCNAFNNQFKTVLELKFGINKITLCFCCINNRLKIEFIPRKTYLKVIPLYIVCKGHEGSFQGPDDEDCSLQSALERISTLCKILQCIVAEKLYELGFKRKTFQLESECKIFNSKLSYEDIIDLNRGFNSQNNFISQDSIPQNKLWDFFAKEIMKSPIGNENYKYVAFLSCTKYNFEKFNKNIKNFKDILSITDGYVALGGGGLALFGSGCMYTWPKNIDEIINRFLDEKKVDKTKFMDDSCYRGTLGACFSTTLGSILHELCHTFDLGHTKYGIMGRGFNNIEKIFLLSQNQRESFLLNSAKVPPVYIRNCNYVSKIDEEQSDDGAYFTLSNGMILNYHKWFNNFDEKVKHVINMNNEHLIKATGGIKVIELRKKDNELVIFEKVFFSKIKTFSFQIPKGAFKNITDCKIFIEDSYGNIVKKDVLL